MQNITHLIKESTFGQHSKIVESFGEFTVYFAKPQEIQHLLTFVKTCKLPFEMLIDICGVHYPENDKPLEVIYHLLSLTQNARLRIIVQLQEGEAVHTAENVYKAACWFERETYDMYGIKFTNSTDSRRILTDYNFQGFPLRKDFPLTGHTEVRYDHAKGEIVYEPVSLVQNYRNFDFQSNWKGEDNNGNAPK